MNAITTSERAQSRYIALIRPPGNIMVEYKIICRNEIGALTAISGIFSKHDLNIEVTYGHADRQDKNYLLILYADFSNASCTIEQTVKELKELPVVHQVEIDADVRRRFDNFLYPIVNVDEERAVIMGLNALIKLEQTLCEKIGSGGAAFLFEMGKYYSMENFKILKFEGFAQDPDSLLTNLRDFLKSSGWGIFEMKRVHGGFDVMISDPQLLDGHTFVDTRFIYGMLAGALQSIFREDFFVLETRYDTRANSILARLRSKKWSGDSFA